jgi:ribosome biogenesis GTPase / thiamine phosphate phosphatase
MPPNGPDVHSSRRSPLGSPRWHDAPMPSIDVDALEDEWDDDVAVGPRGRPLASPAARAERGRQRPGRVIAVDRGRIRVVVDEGSAEDAVDARYGGAMRGRKVVVGDRVRIAPAQQDEPARVVERLERTTELARTGDDLDHHVRVLVADADAVAVIVGADNLEAGLRFADRVIVAATTGGLGTVLVVNKADLVGGIEQLDAALAPYAGAVREVLRVSAHTGEGLDALRSRLAGRWTVFTGHSGVGKTSLTNALVPESDRRTGEVGPRGGRHTTVASVALPLPGGGWLVDTPGVRSFGLGMLDRRGVAAGFPELAGLSCALDDCRHDGEPGCLLPDTDLPPSRRAAFERLADAVEGRTASEGRDVRAEIGDAGA